MFETTEELQNETARQEQLEAAQTHTWVNFTMAPALTDVQLGALRDAAQKCGRPLTPEESKNVLGAVQGSSAVRVFCPA